MRRLYNLILGLLLMPLTSSGQDIKDSKGLLYDALKSEERVTGITIDAESWISTREESTSSMVTSENPSIVHAVFDGLHPSKYRIDYSQYIGALAKGLPGQDFINQEKSLSCDGTLLISLLKKASDIDHNLKQVDEATVDENRGALDPRDLIATGLAFTCSSLPIGGETIFELLEDPMAVIKKVDASEPDLKGCIMLDIRDLSDLRKKVWLDPQRGFALRRFEDISRDSSGNEQLEVRYDVTKFIGLGRGSPYFPSEMSFESFSNSSPLQKIVVKVKSVAITNSLSSADFNISLPPGTLVTDRRLKVSYRVGDVGSIKKQIDKQLEQLRKQYSK